MNKLVLIAVLATACSAAPSNYGQQSYAAPAPYSTSRISGPDAVSVSQPPAQYNKQVHYGSTRYLSHYNTEVVKPQIPDLRIAVPTVLLGSIRTNQPIVHTRNELHTVNEPYNVPRPYNVPYEVIQQREQIVEVPTPNYVARPYPVHQEVAVQGQPIIQKVQGPPVVRHSHQNVQAPAVVHNTHSTSYNSAGGHNGGQY